LLDTGGHHKQYRVFVLRKTSNTFSELTGLSNEAVSCSYVTCRSQLIMQLQLVHLLLFLYQHCIN